MAKSENEERHDLEFPDLTDKPFFVSLGSVCEVAHMLIASEFRYW